MRVKIEIHCFDENDNIYTCFVEYNKDSNTITQSKTDNRTKKIASDALLMTSKILEAQTNQDDLKKEQIKRTIPQNSYNCCETVNYSNGFNPQSNWCDVYHFWERIKWN